MLAVFHFIWYSIISLFGAGSRRQQPKLQCPDIVSPVFLGLPHWDETFWLQDNPGCIGLPVPVNCFGSSTGQHELITLTMEHGPLQLNGQILPWNHGEVVLEMGVKDLPDEGLGQIFSKDPHNTFGSARSVQLSTPPANPTYPQDPSVQDI